MNNEEKNRNACNGASCAYAGSGELTEKDDYATGSWIMDQIDKGYKKCDRGIEVVDSTEGNSRFASLANRIASAIVENAEEFKIVKTYKRLSSSSRTDFRFALRWFIYGTLDGDTVEDLNLIASLLQNRVASDITKIMPAYKMHMDYCGQPTIDFEKSCLKQDGIASFEVNIVSDATSITNYLEKLGFIAATPTSDIAE